MEIKDTEKTVIAKPVACRPGLSNLKSFSELLSGAVSSSSQAAFSESAVAVIRPRTVRFKPAYTSDSVGADIFGSAAGHPTKVVPESNAVSNVIYKPIAKLVSKATVSLLANLGDHGINPIRGIAEVVPPILSNQVNHQTDPTSDSPMQSEKKANDTLENCEREKNKPLLLSSNTDQQTSYDAHSWRKYGQKQVKGSEYPRSYYKCTHPNCPVKKKVEKTLDGQIAEIVYKGEHNHSKPEPLNQNRPDAQEPVHDTVRNKLKNPLVTNQEAGRVLAQNNNTESSAQSTFHGVAPPIVDLLAVAICNASVSASNNSLGLCGECEEVSESLEAEGDDFKSKRRKRENQLPRASTVGKPSSEPQGVVQSNTDTEIIGDGFRWRKYGQKVVKGKIYPRSYYRCTSPKCNVRKYVERTSEDPGTFITTYEGRHNHAMPIKGTNAEASKTSSTKNKS